MELTLIRVHQSAVWKVSCNMKTTSNSRLEMCTFDSDCNHITITSLGAKLTLQILVRVCCNGQLIYNVNTSPAPHARAPCTRTFCLKLGAIH